MPAIPAVAYYRMSTDRQETSIPDQRAEVTAYANRAGCRIIREYLDEGISGDDTERRAGFQKMLKDATDQADFEVVLCWDQDRFGRFDPLEAGYWIKPLRDRGIRLETVAQGRIDWEDFAGRIIYAVQQEGKHAFLRDLSRNVVRGQLAKARAGKWMGGPTPYAYALADGSLVLGDPAQVEIVQWLFRTYAETTTSLRRLAMILNERGVPAPGDCRRKETGTPIRWSGNTVHKILRGEVYVGDWTWNRRHEGKYHGVSGGVIKKYPRKTRQRNDRADWIIRPNNHSPIVDRQLFAAVQRKLTEQQDCKTPRTNGGDFLFTRLLFCAHCGWPMHGSHLHCGKGGRTYSYKRYICGNYNLHGGQGCNCNTMLETVILDVVIRKLQEWFADEANLARLRAEVRRELEEQSGRRPDDEKSIRRRLAAMDKDIGLRESKLHLIDHDMIAAYQANLRESRAERVGLQAELDALAKPPGDAPDLEANTQRAIDELRALPHAAKADRGLLREVLRQTVERVECSFRHVPYGKRQKSVLDHGTITVRLDAVFAEMSRGEGRAQTSLQTYLLICFTRKDVA